MAYTQKQKRHLVFGVFLWQCVIITLLGLKFEEGSVPSIWATLSQENLLGSSRRTGDRVL